MSFPRSLALVASLGFAASCGTKLPCDATSCPSGCCNPVSGRCEVGNSAEFCGGSGATCTTCAGGKQCVAGVCGNPNGGTGGGSATAGGSASAGGAATGGGTASATTFWYKDVLPITQVSCANCHRSGGIGSFPLETFAQAKPMAAAIKSAVVARRMPPWMPDPSCGGTFVGDRRLTQSQIDTIARWADEGAPEGNPADAPAPPGPVGQLPRLDTTLTMAETYTPSATTTDDYRCFLVDPALTGNRFVTGYDIVPGVAAEVHHVIIYVVDRNAARTRDTNEAGPGWTCFGDSGLQSPGPIGAWAPGTGAVIYPAGTGIQLTASQGLAMQIHYNTTSTPRVPDQTSVKLMYSPPGASLTQAYLLPLVGDGFAIPPNATGYTYTKNFPNPLRVAPIKVYGLMPHMHTLGKRITIKGPGDTCLVDIPKWDFHWQQQYFRPQPFTVPVNTEIAMTCSWDNPTTRTIRWGESTSDEMCFAYLYATP